LDPKGKLAVVIGGASGIGCATAKLLARMGARVVVADLDISGAGSVATAICASGGKAWALPVDVSEPAEITSLLDAVVAEQGSLHILHNCAGIVSGHPDFPDTMPERIALLVAINVTATIVATAAGVQMMSRTGGGVVINMSSTAALLPSHPDPVYGASKAAVKVFTEQSAGAATALGVRVNAVLPGAVATPIIAKTGDGRAPAPWLTERMGQIVLLSPETIAEAVLRLIEDDGANGATVTVFNKPAVVQETPQTAKFWTASAVDASTSS
jgi:3-oxoacyl-[acyl-carrier protein] reductase